MDGFTATCILLFLSAVAVVISTIITSHQARSAFTMIALVGCALGVLFLFVFPPKDDPARNFVYREPATGGGHYGFMFR